MMRPVFLVARHEFLETVRSKSFLITLVLIPSLILLGLLIPQWLERSTNVVRNVAIIDLNEGEPIAARIRREIERERAREALAEVNQHVRVYAWPEFKTPRGLDPEKVPSLLLKRRSDISDEDADAFIEKGGLAWAMSIATPFIRPGSPPPVLSPRLARIVETPDGLQLDGLGGDVSQTLRPWLRGEKSFSLNGEDQPQTLDALVLVPKGVEAVLKGSLPALGYGDMADSIQIWSDGALPERLGSLLPETIDRVFRNDALLKSAGGDDAAVKAAFSGAPLVELNVATENGRELTPADMIVRILPRALSMVLIYFLYINMFMLMSNTMEEKSNRIIEVLVSSISPGQLMIGKLLGSSLVAILMLSFSLGAFLAAMSAVSDGVFVEFASLLLDVISNSPVVPAMFINFVLGYFLFAGIFLTLGAFSENSKDVQNLSTPIAMFMMAVLLIVWAFSDDPNGSGARVLSWAPFFGPFMMMARATSEPPLLEVIGSIVVQILTIGALLWIAGRVFRIAVLFSGRPKIGQLFRLVRSGA